jgi:hypothetical protein
MGNGSSIKSLDFIVSPGRAAGNGGPTTWLVDVKGRRFPSGDIQKQYWKNWSTRDDLTSLAQWERLFGETFCGLFVFAYDVLGDRAPLPAAELFEFRGNRYGFIAVTLTDYARHARPISPKWDTWALSAGDFRRYAQPLSSLLRLACETPPLVAPVATAGSLFSPANASRAFF